MIKEMDQWPIGKGQNKDPPQDYSSIPPASCAAVAALVRLCLSGESWLLHCWYKHKMERESIKHFVAVIALEP